MEKRRQEERLDPIRPCLRNARILFSWTRWKRILLLLVSSAPRDTGLNRAPAPRSRGSVTSATKYADAEYSYLDSVVIQNATFHRPGQQSLFKASCANPAFEQGAPVLGFERYSLLRWLASDEKHLGETRQSSHGTGAHGRRRSRCFPGSSAAKMAPGWGVLVLQKEPWGWICTRREAGRKPTSSHWHGH